MQWHFSSFCFVQANPNHPSCRQMIGARKDAPQIRAEQQRQEPRKFYTRGVWVPLARRGYHRTSPRCPGL